MPAIATYVFFDIETTGLPELENNKTKITEISFVAVKRKHFLQTRKGCEPRVLQKLTLCLNPEKEVQPDSTRMTGLCNALLEEEPCFDMEVFAVIKKFLDLLTDPICLIAHYGHGFDFPILKYQFKKLGVSLDDDLMCADCLDGFFDIMEKRKTKIHQKAIISPLPISMARRTIFWKKDGRGNKPDQSYKLKDIYYRLFNIKPDTHRAENDCMLALKCSLALGEAFVQWVDDNHSLFSEVIPMTQGRRPGW